MRATLIGATGAIGLRLLEQLLEHPDYTALQVISRRAIGIDHPKLTCHIHPELSATNIESIALHKTDVSFCCLGTTIAIAGSQSAFRKIDFDLVIAFHQVTMKLGAQQLHTVTALGANPNSLSFYSRTKGETEGELTALNAPYCFFYRPSLLINAKRDDVRLGESIAEWLQKPFAKLGFFKNVIGIDVNKVAKAMCTTALQADSRKNSVITSKEMQSY